MFGNSATQKVSEWQSHTLRRYPASLARTSAACPADFTTFPGIRALSPQLLNCCSGYSRSVATVVAVRATPDAAVTARFACAATVSSLPDRKPTMPAPALIRAPAPQRISQVETGMSLPTRAMPEEARILRTRSPAGGRGTRHRLSDLTRTERYRRITARVLTLTERTSAFSHYAIAGHPRPRHLGSLRGGVLPILPYSNAPGFQLAGSVEYGE